MNRMRADNSLYNLPELEETEFTPAIPRAIWIEDANDLGGIGDSFSIGLDMTDAEDSFAFDA